MILKIVVRNIRFRPLNAILSVLLLTASVGIMSLVLLLQDKIEQHFNNSIQNVDLVLGAKGSPLQLILSAVYQMDSPTGNIPYQEAEILMHHPFVKQAIPLAYGDNYLGFKIVGTESSYISHYKASFEKGTFFTSDFEVVIGSEVAKKLGLQLGSTFVGVHGESEHGEEHAANPYKVVGILKTSGTALDQLILCTIPSVWQTHAEEHNHEEAHEHAAESDHAEEPSSEKEITAVLLQIKNKMAFVLWPRLVAQNTSMQVASPAIETNRLFSLLGFGVQTILGLAYGILAISGISIFIALYANLKDKKYEFALLRTLGASRWHLLVLVFAESLLLAFVGFILGILASRLGLYSLSFLDEKVPFTLTNSLNIVWEKEGWLLGITFLVAVVAAMIPAIKAFQLSISKTLSNA